MNRTFIRCSFPLFGACLSLGCAAAGAVCDAAPAPTSGALLSAVSDESRCTVPKGAKLTYRRVFKSSTPEFIEIAVHEDSDAATYEIRQLDEDPGALPFEVSAALRAKMFELAGKLNHFQKQDLDVHRKIANLGEKTFRWEQDSEVHETKFNYTLNSAANQLLQIFEGLAREQEHLTVIARRMKYDRLGINDALLQFETVFHHTLLPEPLPGLPVFHHLACDSRFFPIPRHSPRAFAH